MKINEILAGLTQTLNAQKPKQPISAGTPTSNATPTLNTGNATPTLNPANINLNKGQTVMLPMGPGKVKTAMKVTNVEKLPNATGKKVVTVRQANKPNSVQQTYDAATLQQAIDQEE